MQCPPETIAGETDALALVSALREDFILLAPPLPGVRDEGLGNETTRLGHLAPKSLSEIISEDDLFHFIALLCLLRPPPQLLFSPPKFSAHLSQPWVQVG